MTKNILLAFIFLSVISIHAQNYKKVKIFINEKKDISALAEAGVELDHLYYSKENNSIDIFMSDEEFNILQSTGFSYQIIIDDWYKHYKNRQKVSEKDKQAALAKTLSTYGVSEFNFGSMGGFYTLAEVITELDSMKTLFPLLVTQKVSIGNTVEARPIYMVKISDNPNSDEDEPEVLYTALHHAREPESMMQLIYFMYYLLENYNSDPAIRFLVDNRELFFIPVVNPDGYEYNRITNPDGAGFWRKNRRDNGNGQYGVDLNRNYGPQNYWSAPNGGSSSLTASENYRGPYPFSEPETQAIRDFLASRKIKTALNYHSYGNLMIYPYGALERETPDSLIFREYAAGMTTYNYYRYGTDQQTVFYSTRGNSDDYFYDGDTTLNSGKIFSMTPEVGGDSDEEGFWPDQHRIIPLAEENLYPNLYIARVAGEYIKLFELNLSRNYVQPGEAVLLYPSFKNIGLKDAYNVHIELSPLDSYSVIQDSYTDISHIPSQGSIIVENPFSISISQSASSSAGLKLLFTASINGDEISRDTISIDIDGAVLPVELGSFAAALENSNIILKWNTYSETNNHGFEIQRGAEPGNFASIAFMKGKGTTTDLSEYLFVDKHPHQGKSFYRLKQVDYDGSYKYSKTLEMNFASYYSLDQNYPNPFNPVTRITYTIASRQFTSLKVYNILGNEVATLVNEIKEPGKYELNFNASSLTSGIYFYKLNSGGYTETKKMVIIR